MQKFTRITALILGIVMLLGVCTACGEKDDEGPYAYAYITASSPETLDPGVPQYDSDLVKYIGLLYEGLFTVDANGKVKKALCKDYYTKEDADGNKKLYIELKDTKWSDGVSVTASNIVYAWKRLLEPSYEGPGASMLLCLKNALKAKEGVEKMMTIDDIGLVELNEKLLEITFEDPDYPVQLFVETLASPYLVPVREELVNSNPTGWATSAVEDPTTIATNGPFSIAAWNENGMTLKRNAYYYLEGISTENKQKYVNVDKIYVKFADAKNAEEIYNNTNNKDADDFLFYLGSFSGENKYKTKSQNMLATTVIYLNMDAKALSSKETRQGLFAALDREKIAEISGGKEATGIVPYGVFETTKSSKQFRKVGGNLLSEYSEAAVKKGGNFTLTIIKDNATHKKVAEEVQKQWKAKGFTVKIRELEYSKFCDVMKLGSYEAILLDLTAYTTDAFSVLAQFSTKYSGRALKQNEKYEYGFIPHSTGYDGENFNKLMDEAFAEKNLKKRASALHEAEEYLVDMMVAVPLYFDTDTYATQNMSGLKSSWYGFKSFNKVSVKNYKKYIEAEEAKVAAEVEKQQKQSKDKKADK